MSTALTTPIRVLVADDQELVRTGFRMILETEDDITVVLRCAQTGYAVDHARAAYALHQTDAPAPDAPAPGAVTAIHGPAGDSVDTPAGDSVDASLLYGPGGTSLIPAPQTDLIYSVIVNEVGLVGACGLLLVYLLLVERGFKVAMVSSDSFSKLLASGLTAVFALQVFVIVGGVTRWIPLTGVTLPFVSYGGSSILANFVLIALLLLVSDRARRPQGAQSRRGLR